MPSFVSSKAGEGSPPKAKPSELPADAETDEQLNLYLATDKYEREVRDLKHQHMQQIAKVEESESRLRLELAEAKAASQPRRMQRQEA